MCRMLPARLLPSSWAAPALIPSCQQPLSRTARRLCTGQLVTHPHGVTVGSLSTCPWALVLLSDKGIHATIVSNGRPAGAWLQDLHQSGLPAPALC